MASFAGFAVDPASPQLTLDFSAKRPYAARMKRLLILPLVLAACAGPQKKETAATPELYPPAYSDGSAPRPVEPAGTAAAAPATLPGGIYVVQSGDSLWLISKRHQVPIAAIKSANGLTSDTIRPGQKLTIPATP
jgi:nucleoid-associated protein YgaU